MDLGRDPDPQLLMVGVVATGNQLTVYDIEQRSTVDSYTLAGDGRGTFVDVTALAGRDFTADEAADLPGDVRRGLICQG